MYYKTSSFEICLPDTSAKRNRGRKTIKTNFNVANRSWEEYVSRLASYYGVFFSPVVDVHQSSLNEVEGVIKAPRPRSSKDFLAFCHELGHLLGRQHPRSLTYRLRCAADTKAEVLYDEYYAWCWGLRYFRRLGFKMDSELSAFVEDCFGSYSVKADIELANKLRKELNKYLTIPMPPHQPKQIPKFRHSADKTTFFFDDVIRKESDWYRKYYDEIVGAGGSVYTWTAKSANIQQIPAKSKDARWNYTKLNKADWRYS